MIFQDPMSSLNPVLTVGDQLVEAIMLHQHLSHRAALDHAREMLELVHMPEARRRLDEYPHQLSGGMRQRVMIAMALSCNPSVLIADEPTTALDVTIQAQILTLMEEIREKLRTAIILITHDLGVVAEMADRVIVMYAGRKVEEAEVIDLFENPRHPYTRGLMTSVPHLEGEGLGSGRKRLAEIPGIVPALTDLPPGCAFADRCPFVVERCRRETPPLVSVGTRHQAACWESERLPQWTAI
jgi:oligopeptide/dipeptide ABC transporter ATP-binding protein